MEYYLSVEQKTFSIQKNWVSSCQSHFFIKKLNKISSNDKAQKEGYMSDNLLNYILNKIRDLPPLPESTHKILQIAGNNASSAKDLAKVLEKDLSLTTKVLKLVNSSFYGFSREISTISQAVVYLGFNTIKSLVLTASSYDTLNKDVVSYELEKGMLWKHSIACASCSRLIAKEIKYSDPEEAYIAGLIHDIGKLMIDQYANNLFKLILEKVTTDAISFDKAEKEVLGFDHPEIGSKIAQKWNFPLSLVESISYHHQPENATNHKELTYIVHLANTITAMAGIGIGNDSLQYNFQPNTLDILQLKEENVQNYIIQLSEIINKDIVS
ncbi:MAG TPA: hydrolase [Candidatus Margulisbacteria bacterium]|nr:hydrolase [Candidatus Margulisiibacteriota bacterium]